MFSPSVRYVLPFVTLTLVWLQGCSDDVTPTEQTSESGVGGDSLGLTGGAGPGTGNETGSGGVMEPGSGGLTGTGGSMEPNFDATGLQLDGDSGPQMCVLSANGRYLLVTVENASDHEILETTVQLSTPSLGYQHHIKTPVLASGASTVLELDRAAVSGFIDDWDFEVVLDPDGLHGGPFTPKTGSCDDLRSRATISMAPLHAFYNTETGLFGENDWWTSANQLETVIDYNREVGDPAYFSIIDNTFAKNSADDFDKWGYYDDDGWWAMAWIKAFDLTQETKYLDMAKTIFNRMKGGWTDQCGGGIYWASPKAGDVGNSNKNAIPNSLFLQIAAKLHLRTPGDSGPGSFLDWAEKEWTWFKGTGMLTDDYRVQDGLNNLTDCEAGGPVFTYNQGVLMGGLVDLAEAKNDPTLLDEAVKIGQATIEFLTTEDGILLERPCGGDICVQFKGIFMRNLRQLHRERPLPEFLEFMRLQSERLFHGSAMNDQNQFGYEWDKDFDKATAGRQSSALDALIAAVGSSNLNLALGASATGSAACSSSEGPERAIDGGSRGASKWCSGGAGGQTLTIDLGTSQTVVGFKLRHAGAGNENAAYNTRDFEIEVSSDGDTWTEVVTAVGNTKNVTDHPIQGVSARYARLHVTTAQTATDFAAARIYEFEVLGGWLDE